MECPARQTRNGPSRSWRSAVFLPNARHRIFRLATTTVCRLYSIAMRIEKWYLDSVTPDGAGVVAYTARVGLGPFALRCSEALVWRAGGPSACSRIAFGGPLPTTALNEVRWQNSALQFEGEWLSGQSGIPTVILYEQPAGKISWTCLRPAAQTIVRIGGDRRDGLGYAEHLVLNLPPGKLPIGELRWGRFIAAEHSCVWIRWQGPVQRNWCYHNGRLVEGVMPDLHLLTWPGHQLQLDHGIVLRSGRVAETAFKGSGPLRWFLPASVRNLREIKWCSRGILTSADGRQHCGWSIHEVVVFPCAREPGIPLRSLRRLR